MLRCERPVIRIPWRIVAQVGSLVVAIDAIVSQMPLSTIGRLGLLTVALSTGVAAAVANNLPVSAAAPALLAAGPAAYAASIGLGVGALATPQGSVATLLAAEVAGADAPELSARTLGPLAAGAVLTATLLLWAIP